MAKYYASCSFGKDSIATILLALKHNEPLDGVVFSEVMFSHEENISGEDPEHIEWIHNVAIPKLYELGCPEIHILRAKDDYVSRFYYSPKRGKCVGKMQGFPFGGKCYLNSLCKVKPIRDFYKQFRDEQIIQYIGIATDEPIRLKRLKEYHISLLDKYGYIEKMAYDLCNEYGLLSPIYQTSNRGGCWFCPNRSIKQFALFREQYPKLWSRLKELNKEKNVIHRTFKYNIELEDLEKQIDNYDYLRKNQLKLF